MKFKKIVSLLTTMMVAAAPICSTSHVNATSDSFSTYIVGDINGNGVVDITDLPLMMQFLRGSLCANARTAIRLDLNQDNLIDSRDLTQLSNLVLYNTQSSSQYPDNTVPLPYQKNDWIGVSGYGVDYTIYSTNGANFGSYKLSPVDEIYTNSSRGIIGNDDRTPEPGLRGVINVRFSNGENNGTAFVVDDHTLLTSAHVLYGKNGVFSGLKFVVFSESNTPLFELHPETYHIPTYFVQNAYVGIPENESRSNCDAHKYDYAIIKVSDNVSNLKNFNLGIANSNFVTSNLKVTGFGAGGGEYDDPNVNSQNINVKSTGNGSVYTRSEYYSSLGNIDSDQLLIYDTDTYFCVSGGPVYVVDGDTKIAIAINQSQYSNLNQCTYNQGVKISTDILHFIYNNINL